MASALWQGHPISGKGVSSSHVPDVAAVPASHQTLTTFWHRRYISHSVSLLSVRRLSCAPPPLEAKGRWARDRPVTDQAAWPSRASLSSLSLEPLSSLSRAFFRKRKGRIRFSHVERHLAVFDGAQCTIYGVRVGNVGPLVCWEDVCSKHLRQRGRTSSHRTRANGAPAALFCRRRRRCPRPGAVRANQGECRSRRCRLWLAVAPRTHTDDPKREAARSPRPPQLAQLLASKQEKDAPSPPLPPLDVTSSPGSHRDSETRC